MKIKKILCGILACSLMATLCACGTEDKKGDETSGTSQTTEAIEATELQKYYDGYFKSEDFKIAGESIEATTGDAYMKVLNAKDGTVQMGFGREETTSEFYITGDKALYAHIVMPNEETGEIEDKWYHYDTSKQEEDNEEDEMKETFSEMGDTAKSSSNLDMYNLTAEGIKNVKYVETKDGIDYLTVSVVNPEYDAEANATTYNIEFTEDGKTYSFDYTTQDNETNSVSVVYNKRPDDFDALDYDFDFDKSVMTNKEDSTKTIPFKVVSKIVPQETVDIELGVDAKTHKVVSMVSEMYDTKTTLKFFDIETINFEKPDKAEECDADTVMALCMAAIFSMVGA